jgi:hypothetical protein
LQQSPPTSTRAALKQTSQVPVPSAETQPSQLGGSSLTASLLSSTISQSSGSSHSAISASALLPVVFSTIPSDLLTASTSASSGPYSLSSSSSSYSSASVPSLSSGSSPSSSSDKYKDLDLSKIHEWDFHLAQDYEKFEFADQQIKLGKILPDLRYPESEYPSKSEFFRHLCRDCTDL